MIMMLIKEIKTLQRSPISKTIGKRLREFTALGKKENKELFSELCFCLLTANSKASTALNIQKELGPKGFLCLPKRSVRDCIKRNKHRFHNNKANYIVEARKHKNIKNLNAAWGSDYKKFEDIEKEDFFDKKYYRSEGDYSRRVCRGNYNDFQKETEGKVFKTRGAYYDWFSFNQYRMTDFNQWHIDGIKAKQSPATVEPSILQTYAGQYGTYKITYEDGALYFERGGRATHTMVSMTED